MREGKVIAEADPAEFERKLNEALREGFDPAMCTINQRPDLKPFTAVLVREIPAPGPVAAFDPSKAN